MTVLPICIVGDPVLHNPTEIITLDAEGKPPADVVAMLDDMYETMDTAKGVGLAANQVGVSRRLFVYDCWDDVDRTGRRRRGEVINPILETSEIPETLPDPKGNQEGCLSVPGLQFPTGRAGWAKVTGVDRNGYTVEVEGKGLFARMLQHEVGHLNGFLYVDILVGGNASAAKEAIKASKWGVPGLTWMPGVGTDPFDHLWQQRQSESGQE
ncbi:peptide deformylase [Triangularia setosa]|uniref:Peptide deformylase n=1 Tax=Triangularia setosa TaxID=2587417 RepID=A0AAN7A543_9PEZI|nr:peptide deformylase [Podospora setosa]